MRILCVTDSLDLGGAQKQLLNLAIHFKNEHHEVSFLLYHEINFFKADLDYNQISVKYILEKNYFLRLYKIRRYVRNGNFQAVLSFQTSPNFICEFASLPRKKWKLIVGERSANPAILKNPKFRFIRWFHLFADSVVANSQANITLVKKAVPFLNKSKLRVIYNLITLPECKVEVLPLWTRKFKILVPARHHRLKNLKGLIEAVNDLSESEKRDLSIYWYGNEGSDNSLEDGKDLIEKYNLTNIFHFNRAESDIIKIMHQMDAVGLFSFYEGLPNAICEAMYIGKPVVCSAVSDLPTLINNKRLLFDPHDYKSISRSLSYLLQLSEIELFNEGYINQLMAKDNFNSATITRKYLNLMQDLNE